MVLLRRFCVCSRSRPVLVYNLLFCVRLNALVGKFSVNRVRAAVYLIGTDPISLLVYCCCCSSRSSSCCCCWGDALQKAYKGSDVSNRIG